MVVGISLILESQTPIAYMVQVLQPLEIRDSHASGVEIQVLGRKNKDKKSEEFRSNHTGFTQRKKSKVKT